MKEASFNSEKFLEISRAALALRPDFATAHGRRASVALVPARRRRLSFRCGLRSVRTCARSCSMPASRGDWPLARELQYKIFLARGFCSATSTRPRSKGGMVMMGRRRRADPAAAAHRHDRTPGLPAHATGGTGRDGDRAARLVITSVLGDKRSATQR